MAKTFTWIGASGGVWQLNTNWSVTGTGGASTYPGESVNTDNVIIDGAHGIPAPPAGARQVNDFTVTADLNVAAIGATGTLKVNGTATIVASAGTGVSGIRWGPASTLAFTGSADAAMDTNADEAGPATITSVGNLLLTSMLDTGGAALDLTGCHITVGGSLLVVTRLDGGAVNLTNAVIVGPGTSGAYFTTYQTTGSPASVTGFEPLYKLGAAGSTLDAYGSGAVITLPVTTDVKSGVVYGPSDNQQLGELSSSGGGGRGGMGLGI